MRELWICSIGFLLAVLLVGTTPIGTGAGTHQFDLLHPLFSHIHIVNGRVLTHEQLAAETAEASPPAYPGPTLGSGTGTTPDVGGPGLSPTLPVPALPMVWAGPVSWRLNDLQRPRSRREAPPDPPPLT
jgi:hypothetical protein